MGKVGKISDEIKGFLFYWSEKSRGDFYFFGRPYNDGRIVFASVVKDELSVNVIGKVNKLILERLFPKKQMVKSDGFWEVKLSKSDINNLRKSKEKGNQPAKKSR